MIYTCPICQKKNRLPEKPRRDGEYRCGECRQAIRVFPSAVTANRAGAGSIWQRALIAINLVYLLIILSLLISNAVGPDQWWPGSLNLYLPQWFWAAPVVLLLPLTLILSWRWSWLPMICLLLVFGPIMGFCGNRLLTRAVPVQPGAERLRVMTYNVKWDHRDEPSVIRDIRAYHPDILQLQDSDGVLRGKLGQELAGWNVRVYSQFIVASRFPLPELEARNISYPDSGTHCVRYTITLGTHRIRVYSVHLLSPRDGLVSVRHRHVSGMVANTQTRLMEADLLASDIAEEPGPTLLTGDLNAPVQSLVCRRLFDAGLRDAFSEAGTGYGYTYGRYTRLGRPYVRIDHIMTSSQWQVERCWVGNTSGSDHCPVIADLVLN